MACNMYASRTYFFKSFYKILQVCLVQFSLQTVDPLKLIILRSITIDDFYFFKLFGRWENYNFCESS